MRFKKKFVIAGTVVVVLAAGGGAWAATSGSSTPPPRANATFRGPGAGVAGGELNASASYLGISQTDLRTELKSGKSLAQIATEHGKSVDGLKQAITASARGMLDGQVASGRITQDQEQRALGNLSSRIDALVQAPGGRFFGGRGPRRGRGFGGGGAPGPGGGFNAQPGTQPSA